MNVIEETRKSTFKRSRKNKKLPAIEISKPILKVVVNNNRQHAKESVDKINEEVGETMIDQQEGLPPQPTGYLKFPDYDWF